MKQKRYLLISLLIFCLFVTLQWGYANTTILSNYRYGLTFKAHTVNQDQRTSLDLTRIEVCIWVISSRLVLTLS